MIGRSGKRWSRISVLAARHNDDDDLGKFKRGQPGYVSMTVWLHYLDFNETPREKKLMRTIQGC